MDWREGIDAERRAERYVLYREFDAELERRRKWEANQERIVTLIVSDLDPLKKFRVQSLTLFSGLCAVVTTGLTIIGWFVR